MKAEQVWENARRFADDNLEDPDDLWDVIIAIRKWNSKTGWRRYGLHLYPCPEPSFTAPGCDVNSLTMTGTKNRSGHLQPPFGISTLRLGQLLFQEPPSTAPSSLRGYGHCSMVRRIIAHASELPFQTQKQLLLQAPGQLSCARGVY